MGRWLSTGWPLLWLHGLGGCCLQPLPTALPPAPASSLVEWLGPQRRWQNQVELAWPATGFRTDFYGTGLRADFYELYTPEVEVGSNVYDIWLDDQLQAPLQTRPGLQTVIVASQLVETRHSLEVRKRTEASVGTVMIGNVVITGGPQAKLLRPAKRHYAHQLLFVGDSITTGYGLLGHHKECHFDPIQQDVLQSYAALVAQRFGADYQIRAYSGKGLYRNRDRTLQPTMRDLWRRSLPNEANSNIDLLAYRPDAVVIALGTNDFAHGTSDREAFETAMIDFCRQLHQLYPHASIVLVAGPMLKPAEATVLRSSLQQAVISLNADWVHTMEFPPLTEAEFGCDYHPNAQAHRRMAIQLINGLHQQLGW